MLLINLTHWIKCKPPYFTWKKKDALTVIVFVFIKFQMTRNCLKVKFALGVFFFIQSASLVTQLVKNLPAMWKTWVLDLGSIPGLGRSPGGGHGNPLQYSCMQNFMDRGAWWVIVHRVTKSQTQLKWLSMHACKQVYPYGIKSEE